MNKTERRVQPRFSFVAAILLILLPIIVICAAQQLRGAPDRWPGPDRQAEVRFERIAVAGSAGAWVVRVDDPRFGGVSALALDREELLALTDSGVLIRLPKPGQGDRAFVHDLPDGPGSPIHKRARDSEALAAVPGGWLVAFENRHSVWRFDRRFTRSLGSRRFDRMGWSVNRGIEAMVALPGGRLLLVPESGRTVVRFDRQGTSIAPLSGASGGVADAVLLPDGGALLLVRELGLLGIRNRLAVLARAKNGYRVRPIGTFGVGPLTNLEAIAAEPLPSGATRLWIMNDNDFIAWRRTILLAIDLPRGV